MRLGYHETARPITPRRKIEKALRQVPAIAASQRVRVFSLSDVNEITLASTVKLYF